MADDTGTTDITSTTADDAPATGAAAADTATSTTVDTGKDVDWKAEAEKWKANSRKNEAAAKRMAALEESQKTEAQKLAERATAAESVAAAAQSQLLRYQVAAEKGLPAELAVRLQGSDAKELAADADKLLALLGDTKGGPPKFNGGPRKTAEGKTDMNALIRSAAGLG